jgi:hypothetical protein
MDEVTMFANKYILLALLILVFIGIGCVPSAISTTPTLRPEPILTPIPEQPTSTVFIGIPKTSNPLVQAEDESVEELVARIAARDISYSQPVLIAFTQVESKEMLLLGISSDRWDIQKCWFYEVDSNRARTDEDLNNYFLDQTTPKIFFAFAYSDSTESLFILEYFHYWDEQFLMDMYRIVIELKDGKWIEKSVLPYFW